MKFDLQRQVSTCLQYLFISFVAATVAFIVIEARSREEVEHVYQSEIESSSDRATSQAQNTELSSEPNINSMPVSYTHLTLPTIYSV